MALSTSVVDAADYLVTLLTSQMTQTGLKAVYYGDQETLPVTPCACVETGNKARELRGVPKRYNLTMEVYVLVYHSGVTDVQTQRRSNDVLAETLEDLIHQDHKMKRTDGTDRFLDAVVSASEPGYVTKGGSVVRATRLTVSIMSQQSLPC